MLAARPHCKLPRGRGKRGTVCGASQRTGDKSERRGEGSRAGELGAPLSHARAPLRERLPHPQALRPPAAQTGSCKKENKAPARAGGGLGRPGAEGRGPAAPRPPPAPPGGPVPTRPPLVVPGQRLRRGSGGGGGGAGSGRPAGAGRGAGAPWSGGAELGTGCHPAAISLCHGSGLLATAASPAAPSRSCRRRRRGLNSTGEARRAAAPRTKGAPREGGGRAAPRRRRDADDLTLPGNSWKWLPPRHRRGLPSLCGRSPPRGCGAALGCGAPRRWPCAPPPARAEKVSPWFFCVARVPGCRPQAAPVFPGK